MDTHTHTHSVMYLTHLVDFRSKLFCRAAEDKTNRDVWARVCVCVCALERELSSEREKERESLKRVLEGLFVQKL